jgi:mannosyltransferase
MKAKTAERYPWLIPALIVVLAFALRLYRVDWQSQWFDETFSVFTSGLDLRLLQKALVWDFVNPPLHSLLLHYWMMVFGSGDFSVRLPSVLAGTATVAMMYPLARRLVDRNAALLATFFMAISQVAIQYSQEARAYAMGMLLGTLCIWFWLEARRTARWACWWLFIAASLLLIYTHYYGISVLIALALWTLWNSKTEPVRWTQWGVLLLVDTVAYIPWLSSGVVASFRASHKLSNNFAAHWITPLTTLNWFHNGKWQGFEQPSSLPVVLVGGVLFLIPVLMALRGARRRPNVMLLAMLFLVAMALPLVPSLLTGMQFAVRYVVYALAPYYILAAVGICQVRPGWLRIAVVMAICVFSARGLRTNYFIPGKTDYRGATAWVSNNERPGDCVVFSPSPGLTPLYWRVYHRSGVPLGLSTIPGDPLPTASSCHRLWLVWDETPWLKLRNTVPPREKVAATLAIAWQPHPPAKFNDIVVQLFETRGAGLPPAAGL